MDSTVRPLTAADFEAVVALDARIGGAARRGYFEKRLRAALRQPRRHLQLATVANGALTGFVLARKVGGEYGDPEGAVVLEAFGVDPAARRSGDTMTLEVTLTMPPPAIRVSQATRPVGSSFITASRTPSEIWSQTLSGWPSVTDSEVNRNSLSESPCICPLWVVDGQEELGSKLLVAPPHG